MGETGDSPRGFYFARFNGGRLRTPDSHVNRKKNWCTSLGVSQTTNRRMNIFLFAEFYETLRPPETTVIYARKAPVASTKIVRRSARYPGGTEDQGLQCSACGKKYSLKHNLARHVRFECGGQRRFSCHLCPNKYTQNVSLRRHLTHHHNVMMPVKKRRIYDRVVYQ